MSGVDGKQWPPVTDPTAVDNDEDEDADVPDWSSADFESSAGSSAGTSDVDDDDVEDTDTDDSGNHGNDMDSSHTYSDVTDGSHVYSDVTENSLTYSEATDVTLGSSGSTVYESYNEQTDPPEDKATSSSSSSSLPTLAGLGKPLYASSPEKKTGTQLAPSDLPRAPPNSPVLTSERDISPALDIEPPNSPMKQAVNKEKSAPSGLGAEPVHEPVDIKVSIVTQREMGHVQDDQSSLKRMDFYLAQHQLLAEETRTSVTSLAHTQIRTTVVLVLVIAYLLSVIKKGLW
eukprot:scpid87912/ scgid17828/ 